GIAARWPVQRRELDLDRPSPPMAEGVDAGTNEKAMEPGVETTRVAQSGQVSPCPDVRLLDRVGGELSIPKDQPSGCVQPCDARADEHGEGVMIASPGPFHESLLVHGCLSSQRSRSGALGWYVGRRGRIVPRALEVGIRIRRPPSGGGLRRWNCL